MQRRRQPRAPPREGLGNGLIGFIKSDKILYGRGIRDGQLIPIMRSGVAKSLLGSAERAAALESFSLLTLNDTSMNAVKAMAALAQDFSKFLGNREFRYMPNPDEQKRELLDEFETMAIPEEGLVTPVALYTGMYNTWQKNINKIRDRIAESQNLLVNSTAEISPLYRKFVFRNNIVVRLMPENYKDTKVQELETKIVENNQELQGIDGNDQAEIARQTRIINDNIRKLQSDMKTLEKKEEYYRFPIVDIIETTATRAIELWALAQTETDVVDPVLCIIPASNSDLDIDSNDESKFYVCMSRLTPSNDYEINDDEFMSAFARLTARIDEHCTILPGGLTTIDSNFSLYISYTPPGARGTTTGVCRLSAIGAHFVKAKNNVPNKLTYYSTTETFQLTPELVQALYLDDDKKSFKYEKQSQPRPRPAESRSAAESTGANGNGLRQASRTEAPTRRGDSNDPGINTSGDKGARDESLQEDSADSQFAADSTDTSDEDFPKVIPTNNSRGRNEATGDGGGKNEPPAGVSAKSQSGAKSPNANGSELPRNIPINTSSGRTEATGASTSSPGDGGARGEPSAKSGAPSAAEQNSENETIKTLQSLCQKYFNIAKNKGPCNWATAAFIDSMWSSITLIRHNALTALKNDREFINLDQPICQRLEDLLKLTVIEITVPSCLVSGTLKTEIAEAIKGLNNQLNPCPEKLRTTYTHITSINDTVKKVEELATNSKKTARKNKKVFFKDFFSAYKEIVEKTPPPPKFRNIKQASATRALLPDFFYGWADKKHRFFKDTSSIHVDKDVITALIKHGKVWDWQGHETQIENYNLTIECFCINFQGVYQNYLQVWGLKYRQRNQKITLMITPYA